MIHIKVAFIAFVFVLCSCHKSTSTASSKADSDGCYSGKLVKKGICGQYVVELQSVDAQGLEIAASWYDSSSSISYQNVFTVANPCDFPATIKQGKTINFTIATSAKNTCSLCEAFTPTPAAKNIVFAGCKTN